MTATTKISVYLSDEEVAQCDAIRADCGVNIGWSVLMRLGLQALLKQRGLDETEKDDEAAEPEKLSEDGKPDSQEESAGEPDAGWNPLVASVNVY